jgi:hypothetical protein
MLSAQSPIQKTLIVTPTDLTAGTKTQAMCGMKVVDLAINFALVQ